MKRPAWTFVVAALAGVVMVLLALSAGLWSVVCFMGGPEGKVGSREANGAALISLTLLALFAAASVVFCKAARQRDDESRGWFATCVLWTAPVVLLAAGLLLFQIWKMR